MSEHVRTLCFAYVANDPMNATDPTGMWIEDVVIGVPSAAWGLWSAGSNAIQGNWGAAGVDLAGVGADVAAIATPRGSPGELDLPFKGRDGAFRRQTPLAMRQDLVTTR